MWTVLMISCMLQIINSDNGLLKGALGQLQPHPQIFFKKVEIFISLEVYTYVVTAY